MKLLKIFLLYWICPKQQIYNFFVVSLDFNQYILIISYSNKFFLFFSSSFSSSYKPECLWHSSLSNLVLWLWVMLELTLVKALSCAPISDRFLNFLTNIRLRQKGLPGSKEQLKSSQKFYNIRSNWVGQIFLPLLKQMSNVMQLKGNKIATIFRHSWNMWTCFI